MDLHKQLQLAQATQNAQSSQIVELFKELKDCYTTIENLNATVDKKGMWIQLSKDHFSVLLQFLDLKQILRIRLVSRQFNMTITQCFPIMAITQQQKCSEIIQQIEFLKAQPNQEMSEPDIVKARHNLEFLKKSDIVELKCLAHPPDLVIQIMSIIYNILMGKPTKINEKTGGWKEYQQVLNNPGQFIQTLFTLDIMNLNQYQLKQVGKIQQYDQQTVQGQSKAAGSLYAFVQGVYESIPNLGNRVQLSQLESQLKSTQKYCQFFSKD